ncbi:hypothetical protein GA0115250_134032 [Streptomyces sp. BvitLS-983]|jgi:hypothetical protein|uniref:Uncharacterized protein n=1 Tax=Streptomyces albidoflavus TaxID=1886 RepID=A0AA37C2J9_9ACTN|nr:hypothetical protein MTP02_41160 [Streptomyces albus]GHI48163.1 hypothetical protein ScoT_43370 [Streptomyces albidoflavus]SCE01695.1 hypothetical protein GA0115250_134032 [Streptomyces sp. BvitLS-983]
MFHSPLVMPLPFDDADRIVNIRLITGQVGAVRHGIDCEWEDATPFRSTNATWPKVA